MDVYTHISISIYIDLSVSLQKDTVSLDRYSWYRFISYCRTYVLFLWHS